jgi:hypothetical protein
VGELVLVSSLGVGSHLAPAVRTSLLVALNTLGQVARGGFRASRCALAGNKTSGEKLLAKESGLIEVSNGSLNWRSLRVEADDCVGLFESLAYAGIERMDLAIVAAKTVYVEHVPLG